MDEKEDELRRRNMWFDGHVPEGLYHLKEVALTQPDASMELLEECRGALQDILLRLRHQQGVTARSAQSGDAIPREVFLRAGEAATFSSVDVTVRDVSHARFILIVCCRRLGDLASAMALCWESILEDPADDDSLESMVELCLSGEAGMLHLRPLLDCLQPSVQYLPMPAEADDPPAESQVCEVPVDHSDAAAAAAHSTSRYVLVFALMADMMRSAIEASLLAEGEGAAAAFVSGVVRTILGCLRRDYEEGRLLLESLVGAVEERLSSAALRPRDSASVASARTAVAVCKALLAMELSCIVDDYGGFELRLLMRLQDALRLLGRGSECHGIGQRMIQHVEHGGYQRDRVGSDEMREQIDTAYRQSLFAHVHDEAVLRPRKMLPMLAQLIGTYPHLATPWKILALALTVEGKKSDAVVACRRAMIIDPSDPTTLMLLGNLYSQLGHAALAAEVLFNAQYLLTVASAVQEGSVDEATVRSAQQGIADDTIALEGRLMGVQSTAEIKREHDEWLHQVQMYRATLYSNETGLAPLQWGTIESLPSGAGVLRQPGDVDVGALEAARGEVSVAQAQEERRASVEALSKDMLAKCQG